MNTFITTHTAHYYWNLPPARRIDSQYQTSYTDNGSLGSSPRQNLTSAQSKGSRICTAATNTFNNQLLIEDERCYANLGVMGSMQITSYYHRTGGTPDWHVSHRLRNGLRSEFRKTRLSRWYKLSRLAHSSGAAGSRGV
jgi:hypothetical protein